MYIARFYKKEDTIGIREQSLKEHIQNVSILCGKFAMNSKLTNTATLCGYLHDIGKYSEGFQNYINEQEKCAIKNNDNKNTLIEHVDHGVYGATYIYNIDLEKLNLTDKKYSIAKILKDIIAEVVCYHHGGLPDNLNDNEEVFIPIIKRMNNNVSEENLNKVINIFKLENQEFDLNELFLKAIEEIENLCGKHRKRIIFMYLTKLLYSYLVDADRWDSYLFTAYENEKEKYDKQLQEFDYSKIINMWKVYNDRLENVLNDFTQQNVKTPLEIKLKDARENVSIQCKTYAQNKTGIYTLTVPTGGGKTLASFRFALNHSINYKKTKIIYVLPYTTIIEQNAETIRKTINCGEELLEYHSNVLDENKGKNYEILSERWNSTIIFTTMVQFLNSIFATGNANIRRMHQLENSVIIFDEIQTLPIKCTKLFYSAIEFLKNICNTTSVLCTATQPDFTVLTKKCNFTIDGEIIKDVSSLYKDLKRMNVIDKTNNPLSYEEVSDFAISEKNKTNSVLIILNKIESTEKIFNIIKQKSLQIEDSNTKVYILTSRMCPNHRKKVIDEIKNKLNNNEPVICVSTQLIEAGVDISFSTVIRSLAGLDSVAQASGRGNRNGEMSSANTFIVCINEEKLQQLPHIKLGQECTNYVLHKTFSDLLSPEPIKMFYRYFYSDENCESMDFKLYNSNSSIFELLSDNKARKQKYKGKEDFSIMYQFETARKNFNVIDNKTITLVVPYNEDAKNLIGILLSNKDLKEKYDTLRKAQKYTVNIYKNVYDKLIELNAISINEKLGVSILTDEYYNGDIGVSTTKNKSTILCF